MSSGWMLLRRGCGAKDGQGRLKIEDMHGLVVHRLGAHHVCTAHIPETLGGTESLPGRRYPNVA